jgi:putative oxidoreductase
MRCRTSRFYLQTGWKCDFCVAISSADEKSLKRIVYSEICNCRRFSGTFEIHSVTGESAMQPRFDLNYLRHHEHRSQLGWLMLRLTVAGIIAAHGWTRVFNGGVLPFGEFLNGHGFVIGTALAMFVTGSEIIGSVLLILGKYWSRRWVCCCVVYGMGIVLVHAKEGWFVVGPGNGGAEYSVLLIVLSGAGPASLSASQITSGEI